MPSGCHLKNTSMPPAHIGPCSYNTWGAVQTRALQWPQPPAVSAAPCCAGGGIGLQPGQQHRAGQPVCTQPHKHALRVQHLRPEGSDPSPAGLRGHGLSQWWGCREEGKDTRVLIGGLGNLSSCPSQQSPTATLGREYLTLFQANNPCPLSKQPASHTYSSISATCSRRMLP